MSKAKNRNLSENRGVYAKFIPVVAVVNWRFVACAPAIVFPMFEHVCVVPVLPFLLDRLEPKKEKHGKKCQKNNLWLIHFAKKQTQENGKNGLKAEKLFFCNSNLFLFHHFAPLFDFIFAAGASLLQSLFKCIYLSNKPLLIRCRW